MIDLKPTWIALGMALSTVGCATSFTGAAHIEGGRPACERKCAGQGMELEGMVYMGEYSSACVCRAPGRTARAEGMLLSSAAAASGGAAAALSAQRDRAAMAGGAAASSH